MMYIKIDEFTPVHSVLRRHDKDTYLVRYLFDDTLFCIEATPRQLHHDNFFRNALAEYLRNRKP